MFSSFILYLFWSTIFLLLPYKQFYLLVLKMKKQPKPIQSICGVVREYNQKRGLKMCEINIKFIRAVLFADIHICMTRG